MSEKNFIFKYIETNKIAIQSFVQKNEYKEYDIENLKKSIQSEGIMQPVGLYKNHSKDFKEFDYLVLWGFRRLLVAHDLKLDTVPAMVLEKEITEEEILNYSSQEAGINEPVRKIDVWSAIKELFIIYGDEKIISKKTGLPLRIVKDALKAQRIDRLKGGREVYDHTTETCSLPTSIAHKVLDAVMKPDNVSVDKKKGKKLADVLAVQDVQMRNKVLKAALNTPEGDVDGWVADAKNMRSYIKKTIELVDMENEALSEYANSLGMDDVDVIKELVITKLQEDGFI